MLTRAAVLSRGAVSRASAAGVLSVRHVSVEPTSANAGKIPVAATPATLGALLSRTNALRSVLNAVEEKTGEEKIAEEKAMAEAVDKEVADILARPIRIAFVGCKHVGKTSLVNALLSLSTSGESTSPSPASRHPLMEGLTVDEQYAQLLSFGGSTTDGAPQAQLSTATSRDHDLRLLSIAAPLAPLQHYHADILVTPALTSREHPTLARDKWLSTADVIVVVSDVLRQFEEREEGEVLVRWRAKKPILVMNHVDRVAGPEELEMIVKSIDKMLQERIANDISLWKFLTTSTRISRKISGAANQEDRVELLRKSGVADLDQYLFSDICGNEEVVRLTKMKTEALKAEQTAMWTLSVLSSARELLESKQQMFAAVGRRNADFIQDFLDEFDTRDMSAIDRMASSSRDALLSFYRASNLTSITSTMTTAGSLSDRLFSSVFGPLRTQEAEHAMSYAVGRLNEGGRGLAERLERVFNRVVLDTRMAQLTVPANVSDPTVPADREIQTQNVENRWGARVAARHAALRDMIITEGDAGRLARTDPFFLSNSLIALLAEMDAQALCRRAQRRVTMLTTAKTVGYVAAASGLLAMPLVAADMSALTLAGGAAGIAAAYGAGNMAGRAARSHGRLVTNVHDKYAEIKRKIREIAETQVRNVTVGEVDEIVQQAVAEIETQVERIKSRQEMCRSIAEEARAFAESADQKIEKLLRV